MNSYCMETVVVYKAVIAQNALIQRPVERETRQVTNYLYMEGMVINDFNSFSRTTVSVYDRYYNPQPT